MMYMVCSNAVRVNTYHLHNNELVNIIKQLIHVTRVKKISHYDVNQLDNAISDPSQCSLMLFKLKIQILTLLRGLGDKIVKTVSLSAW